MYCKEPKISSWFSRRGFSCNWFWTNCFWADKIFWLINKIQILIVAGLRYGGAMNVLPFLFQFPKTKKWHLLPSEVGAPLQKILDLPLFNVHVSEAKISEALDLNYIITSNYWQIWRPDLPMSLIVSSIAEGVNEQNSIVNKCQCRWLLSRSLVMLVGHQYSDQTKTRFVQEINVCNEICEHESAPQLSSLHRPTPTYPGITCV